MGYVFRPLNINRDLYALRTIEGSIQEVFYPNKNNYNGTLSIFKQGENISARKGPGFLVEVLRLARKITDKPHLIRLDSGNDSADNIIIFMKECLGNQVHCIIKRNIRREQPQAWLDKVRDVCTNIKERREGKKNTSARLSGTYPITFLMILQNPGRRQKIVGIKTIYDITERTCDHDRQYYIFPKIECDMYSVNVDFPDEDIVKLYHKHLKWNIITARSRQTSVQNSFHPESLRQTSLSLN